MTLSTILTPFGEANYRDLFTPSGGFLHYDGKSWKVTKQKLKPSEIVPLTLALAGDLNSPKCQLENKRDLIQKVNALTVLKLPRTLPKEIDFSSKSKDYSFFSNFHPTLLQIGEEPTVFTSSEIAYQTLKGQLAQNENQLPEAYDPLKAKKKGRKLEVNEEDKLDLMERVLRAKFSQNPTLSKALCSTGDIPLFEATKDKFWGKDSGNGQNQLGKLLMKLRSEYQLQS